MTEDRRLRLSALVDGEIRPAELRATLAESLLDPELGASWERYQLIGRVLRGEAVSVDARSIAGSVAERLAQEPAPAAAASTTAVDEVQAGARRRRAAAAGPIVGAALAAGLALVAVVVGPRLGPTGGGFEAPPLASAPPAPASAPAASLALPSAADRWSVGEPDVASKLNELLVSHRERSSAAGFGGLIPYAAVVGYAGSR